MRRFSLHREKNGSYFDLINHWELIRDVIYENSAFILSIIFVLSSHKTPMKYALTRRNFFGENVNLNVINKTEEWRWLILSFESFKISFDTSRITGFDCTLRVNCIIFSILMEFKFSLIVHGVQIFHFPRIQHNIVWSNIEYCSPD